MEDLKDKILGEKKISKKRGQGVWVAVGIIALVVIAFIIGMFGDSGDDIGKTWLGDRISGSFGDIIGVLLFLAGISWIVYLLVGKEHEKVPVGYGSKKQEWLNIIIAAALLVGGFLLFWHL